MKDEKLWLPGVSNAALRSSGVCLLISTLNNTKGKWK